MNRLLNCHLRFEIYTLLGVFGSEDFIKEERVTKRDDRSHRQSWNIVVLRILRLMGSECPSAPFPPASEGEGRVRSYESFPPHHLKPRSPEHGSNGALKYLPQGKVLA